MTNWMSTCGCSLGVRTQGYNSDGGTRDVPQMKELKDAAQMSKVKSNYHHDTNVAINLRIFSLFDHNESRGDKC